MDPEGSLSFQCYVKSVVRFANASHSIYSLQISFCECYDSWWHLLPEAMQILSGNKDSAVSEISGNFPIAIDRGRIGLNTNTRSLTSC